MKPKLSEGRGRLKPNYNNKNLKYRTRMPLIKATGTVIKKNKVSKYAYCKLKPKNKIYLKNYSFVKIINMIHNNFFN